MIKEASLITKAGVPMWVRSSSTSVVSSILTGAMLGALSMFSSEVTGQSLRSLEMSGGFKLHVRSFHNGEINLALIGDETIFSDPSLRKITRRIEEDISIMTTSGAVDITDPNTVKIYLEEAIDQLDAWFSEKVFVNNALQRARSEQVVEISSKIAIMSSRFSKESIGVLILDSSLQALLSETTDVITEEFFANFQDHFSGWLKASSSESFLPSMIFFDRICLGIGVTNSIYVICAIEWNSSIGDQKVTSKVRSWVSLLSRRIS